MYIFEFTHKLTQKDLADIWQNLPPDDTLNSTQEGIGMNFKAQEQIISHDLMPPGISPSTKIDTEGNMILGGVHPLIHHFEEDTKWMLFKVKQKANWNYFSKTAMLSDDDKFKFTFGSNRTEKAPKYSYNWPYDYFSLVELVKMDAEVKFDDTDFVLDGVKISGIELAAKLKKIKETGKKFGLDFDPTLKDLTKENSVDKEALTAKEEFQLKQEEKALQAKKELEEKQVKSASEKASATGGQGGSSSDPFGY
jgi:hypothetical protein